LAHVEVALAEDAGGGARDVSGRDVVQPLEAGRPREEPEDVPRAVDVDLHSQLARDGEVVHGREVMGGGQLAPQPLAVAPREAQPGLGDVADRRRKAAARRRPALLDGRQLAPGDVEEALLDEADEALAG